MHRLLAFVTLVLAHCAQAAPIIGPGGCASSYDASQNYFPLSSQLFGSSTLGLSQVQVAQLFTVAYQNNYKYVRSLSRGDTYVLYQCGTPQPTPEAVLQSFPTFNASTAKYIQVPVKTVATGLTTTLAFLDILGLRNSVKVADLTYATNPCLQKLAQCGALTHVSSSNRTAWAAAVSAVDIVLTDAFGTASSRNPNVPNIAFDATTDPGILNRAEWVKFLSVFFNAEPAANALYSGLQTTFQTQLSGAWNLLVSAPRAPVAGVLSHSPGSVSEASPLSPLGAGAQALVSYAAPFPPWTPNATWSISMAAFKQHYPKLPAGSLGSFATAAAFRAAVAGIDVLVDETYAPDPRTFTMDTFMSTYGFTAADTASGVFPFLTNARVFRQDKTINAGTYGGLIGMDWYESAVAMPERVLADFVSVLYPGSTTHATRWLRNLSKTADFISTGPEMCLDPSVGAICGYPSPPPSAPKPMPPIYGGPSSGAARSGFATAAGLIPVILIFTALAGTFF